MVYHFTFYFTVFTAEQKEGFSLPKGCLCPGENLRFECIIEGGGITVWNGTLLTCPPTNDIPISHHTFREGEERNISVKCNHDSVTASLRYWRVVNSSDYYSQVNVSREVNSSSLNGSTVTCAHDDGSVVTVVSSWKIVGMFYIHVGNSSNSTCSISILCYKK